MAEKCNRQTRNEGRRGASAPDGRRRAADDRLREAVQRMDSGLPGCLVALLPAMTRSIVPRGDHALTGRMKRLELLIAVRFKKPATGFRRGLNSCDVDDMPVICPTCQIISDGCRFTRNALSIESLNWRRGACPGKRLGRFDGWRRTYLGGRLFSGCKLLGCKLLGSRFLGSKSGWCCASSSRSRCRPLNSPGTRDRGPRCISNECTCHRAHRSQDDRSRHCAQGSISRAVLSSCFQRNKRRCDQCGNKQFLHRGSPECIGARDFEIAAAQRCDLTLLWFG
jgi:hypothetical protein